MIELSEYKELSVVVIAVIANGLSDDGVVFLFDKAAVILAIWSTAGA